MSQKKVIAMLRKYEQAAPNSSLRKRYLEVFAPLMVFRTTKTENPELSRQMVERILMGRE